MQQELTEAELKSLHQDKELIRHDPERGDLVWAWEPDEKRWHRIWINTQRGERKVRKPLTHEIYREKYLELIAACDLETDGLGGKLLDACVVLDGDPTYYHFNDIGKLFQFFREHARYTFYFHNGAGYDFSYFAEEILDLGEREPIRTLLVKQGQARVIGMKLVFPGKGNQKRTVTLKDSLPQLIMSLKKAAEYFAPEFPKLDIGLAEGETYDPSNPEHVAYLHRDCDALLAVLKRYYSLIDDTFGVSPGWTAGSTAVHAWKAHIPEGIVYYRCQPQDEEEIRHGYYGGYCYPGHDILLHHDVVSIDINAAYAAAMRKGVPVARTPVRCSTPEEFEEFRHLYGVWEVIATIPKSIPFPIVPSRDRHGNMRWATGRFKTWITSQEIVYSEARGCRFDILRGYGYRNLEYPFNDFLQKCEYLELALGGAVKQLIKTVRNAFYGKFGSKLEDSRLEIMRQFPDDEKYRPLINPETGEIVQYLVEFMEENNSNYVMPIWATYITMWERLFLFDLIEAVGPEHVFYCDTDSIKGDASAILSLLERGVVSCEPGYGNVKVDEQYEWFQCLGAKNYRGKLVTGEYIGKIKGIPKNALYALNHFLAAHGQTTQAMFSSVNGVLPRLKDETTPMVTRRARTLGNVDHSASWVKSKEGLLRPIHVEEV